MARRRRPQGAVRRPREVADLVAPRDDLQRARPPEGEALGHAHPQPAALPGGERGDPPGEGAVAVGGPVAGLISDREPPGEAEEPAALHLRRGGHRALDGVGLTHRLEAALRGEPPDQSVCASRPDLALVDRQRLDILGVGHRPLIDGGRLDLRLLRGRGPATTSAQAAPQHRGAQGPLPSPLHVSPPNQADDGRRVPPPGQRRQRLWRRRCASLDRNCYCLHARTVTRTWTHPRGIVLRWPRRHGSPRCGPTGN